MQRLARLLILLPLLPAAAVAGLPAARLQALIDAAQPGQRLLLPAGHYSGRLLIDKALVIDGRGSVTIDGEGHGDVIRVRAADVTLSGLEIVRSGFDLTAMNAGIFVERQAARVRILDNRLDRVAFGIWLDACVDAEVRGNRIHGDPGVRSQDRGNGIHLYAVTGAVIANNEVSETRDGIYIDTSNGNRLEDNLLHDLRYGIHYMYSYSNLVAGNHTRNTRTGYALMQSKYLTVRNNVSENDGNYGILMNYIVHSEISGNRVLGTRAGRGFVTGGEAVAGAEGKALFIYNSQFNRIHHNLFQDADIGIHLTAGSEDNEIYGNAFIDNRVQVKYVASRPQEWSREGTGNYWSDYLGWDLNADGRGDKPYEPNDAVDLLLWKYPLARVLFSSPAVETLRWVQQQFPVLKPQGVRDSHPLMAPPAELRS